MFGNGFLFYIELFKVIKSTHKVINVNTEQVCPNLQLGFGNDLYLRSCTHNERKCCWLQLRSMTASQAFFVDDVTVVNRIDGTRQTTKKGREVVKPTTSYVIIRTQDPTVICALAYSS